MLPVILLLAQASDREALPRGVGPLAAPGALPGALVALKGAFIVLQSGGKPVFVAGHVGAGRALNCGHGAFFGPGPLQNPSNARFLSNALAWLGARPLSRLRVGTLRVDALDEWARRAGADVVSIRREDLPTGLIGLDVLAMGQDALAGDAAAQTAVVTWVKAGHGLLVTGPAWGWLQLNPGKDLLRDLPTNRMLLPYGLGASDETAYGAPSPQGADDPLLQTESALEALRKGGLGSADAARAGATAERALSLDPTLIPELPSLARAEGAKGPVTRAMPFTRLFARVQARTIEEGKGATLGKHPSADDFPGIVPSDAARSPRTLVPVDKNRPGWANTGLYAAPGEVVTVTAFDTDLKDGLVVRVGPHTDELWELDRWDRFPKVSYRWPITERETRVVSPFGGTIYIEVPRGAHNGTAVWITHAVPAPRYVPGQVTNETWAKMLATPGAPWVELEGAKVVLSLPRTAVATLQDPVSLMRWWDGVVDLCFAFYAAPPRDRPERYCADRQISAGYMHSGYPIMTGLDVAKTFADLDKLKGKGATWGFFHELGHNFQEGDWTFEGTGEVTNNLFSLYASEKLNGVTPADYGAAHPAMAPAAQRKRLAAYLAKGARFEDWKSDPFLALTMYAQVREAFGWEPFTAAFAAYRADRAHPRTEEAKHDLWMARLSRATGRNLGPFFVAWGVPMSEAARASVAGLPSWMPADWPR